MAVTGAGAGERDGLGLKFGLKVGLGDGERFADGMAEEVADTNEADEEASDFGDGTGVDMVLVDNLFDTIRIDVIATAAKIIITSVKPFWSKNFILVI